MELRHGLLGPTSMLTMRSLSTFGLTDATSNSEGICACAAAAAAITAVKVQAAKIGTLLSFVFIRCADSFGVDRATRFQYSTAGLSDVLRKPGADGKAHTRVLCASARFGGLRSVRSAIDVTLGIVSAVLSASTLTQCRREDSKASVRPRKGFGRSLLRCHLSAPGRDHLAAAHGLQRPRSSGYRRRGGEDIRLTEPESR